jgi:A/G-specific adenine glycosylase
VSPFCDAREAGDAADLPRRLPKRAPKVVHAVAVRIERGGRMLAVQRPAKGLLGGLWELPGAEISEKPPRAPAVAALLRDRTGLGLGGVRRLGAIEYGMTHRDLRLAVYRADVVGGRVRLDGWSRHRWVTRAALDRLPIGTVTRRVLEVAFGPRG